MLSYLKGNIEFTQQFLQTYIPKIKLIEPEGTYLLWLDFREYGLSDTQIRQILLTKAKVGLNHGPDFGTGGEGFQRINIGCPRQTLKEALEKIKNAFN
jgi:cystathionine beta-lyase